MEHSKFKFKLKLNTAGLRLRAPQLAQNFDEYGASDNCTSASQSSRRGRAACGSGQTDRQTDRRTDRRTEGRMSP